MSPEHRTVLEQPGQQISAVNVNQPPCDQSRKNSFFLQKIRIIEYYCEAVEVVMLQQQLTINASSTYYQSVYKYYSDTFRFLKLETLDLDLDTSCFRYTLCGII